MRCQNQLKGKVEEKVAALSLTEPYRLRAKLPAFKRAVARSAEIIKEARQRGPCYVAFSGGKDSLALLHLARSLFDDIEGYHFDSGADAPEAYETINAVRQAGYPVHDIKPERTIIEMFKIVGMYGYTGPDKKPGDWHWKASDFWETLIAEPARRVRSLGYPVALLGLRKGESWRRRMIISRWGEIYQRKDGAWTCSPLAHWHTQDVFAYCVLHDLPLSRLYLDPRITSAERELRRTACVLGDPSLDDISCRLQYDHPALYREIVGMFPDLK